MLYWYRDMMYGEFVKRRPKRHIHRVERYYRALPKTRIFSRKKRIWEHWIGKRVPWREYYVVMRAVNPDDLFDVMGTRQWIMRHYSKMDIYVIGLFTSRYEAILAMEEMLRDAYRDDPDFSPKEHFGVDKDYELCSDYEAGAY